MATEATSWGRLVRAEFGRFGLRRPGRGPEGPAVASVVRPRTLVAFLVLGMLFMAASWVDAGTAASPDPDPSAKESKAPAPDPYQPAAPSPTPAGAGAGNGEPVTQPVIQVETTPSTGTSHANAGTSQDRHDVGRSHAEEAGEGA